MKDDYIYTKSNASNHYLYKCKRNYDKSLIWRIFSMLKYKLSIRKPIISTDEDPSLRIESFAIINLGGVSTKLYFNLTFTMQTYKELI